MNESFMIGTKNEKEMFQSWLFIEKERWERARGHDYEETSVGFRKEGMMSSWQSALYREIVKQEKTYTYLYTYLWKDEIGKFYYVDFGEEVFDFRMNLAITDNFFSAEILLKEKEEREYGRLTENFPYVKGNTEQLKRLIEELLAVYEKVRSVVLGAHSNRLLVVVRQVDMYEAQIEEIKAYCDSLL